MSWLDLSKIALYLSYSYEIHLICNSHYYHTRHAICHTKGLVSGYNPCQPVKPICKKRTFLLSLSLSLSLIDSSRTTTPCTPTFFPAQVRILIKCTVRPAGFQLFPFYLYLYTYLLLLVPDGSLPYPVLSSLAFT